MIRESKEPGQIAELLAVLPMVVAAESIRQSVQAMEKLRAQAEAMHESAPGGGPPKHEDPRAELPGAVKKTKGPDGEPRPPAEMETEVEPEAESKEEVMDDGAAASAAGGPTTKHATEGDKTRSVEEIRAQAREKAEAEVASRQKAGAKGAPPPKSP